MILYHATLKSNLDSINAKGIDPEFSQGKESVIWLHTAGRREWAILHTQKRHNCALDDIIVITVKIPRGWIRRRRTGLWTSNQIITPFNITDAAELAASPFE